MTKPIPATVPLEMKVVPSRLLSATERKAILVLCERAYEEDLASIFDTFADPIHVLGYCDGKLVCHACWVSRYLQPDPHPVLHTAYVEAVATDPDYQRRGFAAAIMRRVVEELHDYDLAALSPFSVDYYARLGWERWNGPLFIRTDDGVLPTETGEDVMIYRLPQTPALDLSASLSAEWRAGELW